MEKRQLIFGMVVLFILLIAGCGTQEMVCNAPYIQFENGCCLDQNNNKICDNDDTGMFEPTYDGLPLAEVEKKDSVMDKQEYAELVKARETLTKETATTQQEEETEEAPEPAVTTPKYASKTVVVAPKPYNWNAGDSYLSMEVTKVAIQIANITPKDRISPDKEVYLKELVLRVRNNKYYYLHPKITFMMYDEKDSIILEYLECIPGDRIKTIGCTSALRDGDEMNITFKLDQKMPRIYINKTIDIILVDRGEVKSTDALEIKKSFDLFNLPGAVYS